MSPHASSAAAWCEAGVRPGVRSPGDLPRWERCVDHRGNDVRAFAEAHFGEAHRRPLLIGGAGFDPRALTVPRLLSAVSGERMQAVFLRERRPNPAPALLSRADRHADELATMIARMQLLDIQVFEPDGAVALGRRVVDAVRELDLSQFTDVVVDLTALSVGSSFPLTRLILQRIENELLPVNLHAMVTASPQTDNQIVPSPSSFVGPVHGFQGKLGIDETAGAAKLWIPQLRFGHAPILDRIHELLKPDDVVPVLPFPALDPRTGDRLIEHYASEFENRWEVDARSIVYADETNPLDFYRTVLRIHDRRNPVFSETIGSLLVLSPIGSKVLALGAMMAATERDLPVVYVEAADYVESGTPLDRDYSDADIVHVWLMGEAYPPPNPVAV